MVLFTIVFLPVIFVLLIALVGDRAKPLRNALAIIPSIICFGLVSYLALQVLQGNILELNLVDFPYFMLKFKADPLAVYLALSMTFLWIMTDIYSFGYMAHEHAQTRYYGALTLNLTAAMGIVFASNLITFFIFFEILTVAVYPLVIHEETPKAYEAGIMYGIYLLSGGAAVLAGIVMVYNLTGTVEFMVGGIPALAQQSKFILTILFILFTFGFGFKASLVPLYAWLPEAMIAPTPISAVLHAVAVVNVGVFGFFRTIGNVFGFKLYQSMGFGDVIAVIAAITILWAAVLGLRQREIKRMLAMSTMNQLSYMLLGLVSFHAVGMLGGILHIHYHAFMKIALFYCAGSFITQSGNKYVAKIRGIGRYMPITAACFAAAAVGIIGLPPMCGWVSKWYILQGYWSIGKPVYIWVLIISSLMELGFLGVPAYSAFFHEPQAGAFSFPQERTKEAPWSMVIPTVIVTVLAFIFGIWGFVPHRMAETALNWLMG